MEQTAERYKEVVTKILNNPRIGYNHPGLSDIVTELGKEGLMITDDMQITGEEYPNNFPYWMPLNPSGQTVYWIYPSMIVWKPEPDAYLFEIYKPGSKTILVSSSPEESQIWPLDGVQKWTRRNLYLDPTDKVIEHKITKE